MAWVVPAAGQLIGPNIPATPGLPIQNEPQVAAFGNTLVAVWYRDDFTRASGWGLSVDSGDTWNEGGAFTVADPNRDGTWGQSTVCVDGTGRFYAATVYSADWWGIAVYRGTPQGGSQSWEGPIFAVPPTLVPGFDLSQALDAVRLTCDPERGYLYLTYTRSRAVAYGQFEYTIQFIRSLDGGTTWSAPLVLSGGIASNGSRPAAGPDGEVYVAWEDFSARQVMGRRSMDYGATFGPPFLVGEIRDNLGTRPPYWQPPPWRANPSVTPSGQKVASDFPSIAVDRSTGSHRGRIYATWTDFAEGTVDPQTGGSYDLEPNGSFGSAAPVEIGHTLFGEARSPDHVPGGDGDYFTFDGSPGTTIQITGRITNVFPQPSLPVYQALRLLCGADTLQLTEVAQSSFPLRFEPGPPPILYTLMSPGPYYLVTGGGDQHSFQYEIDLRSVSLLPGQVAQDHRDIVLTWSDDGGATWAPKQRVGNAPANHDESFPSVAVDDLGRVHVAWYDRRDETGCGELVNTYWTYSVDGGATFVAARRISTEPSSWRFISLNDPLASNIGDHLGLATNGCRVHVLWTDTRDANADIYAVRIDDLPTGIAVPRFVAEAIDSYIRLTWTVADAGGITGFRVHRAEGTSEAFEVLEADPRGSTGPGDYLAEDRSVVAGRSYRYRLEILREGGSVWEGPVEASVSPIIGRLSWHGASPNPFTRAIRLDLAAPQPGEVWVRVYDLAGSEVATLYRGVVPAGVNPMTWEGRDQAGRPLAAGVYLLRADLAEESATRRVVLIR